MKKVIVILLVSISMFSISAKKTKQAIQIPAVEAQIEKADKIKNYRAKTDVAWHKTEYNKVLKYLNKKKK